MGRTALPPGSIRVQVFEVPGRAAPWCVRVLKRLPSGKDRPKHSFFTTEKDAQSTAESLRSRAKRESVTLGRAIELHVAALLSRCQPTSVYPAKANGALRSVLAAHLLRPLVDFTADQAEAIFDRLTGEDGGAPQTGPRGRRYAIDSLLGLRGYCHSLFTWARQRKLLPRDRINPFKDVKIKGARRKGQKPHLQRHQILDLFLPALCQELEEGRPRALFIGVQFYGGCRPSEVRLRTIDDVEPDGSVFYIPSGKNANARRKFPLGPMAKYMAAYCATVRAQGGLYLFSQDGHKPYGSSWPIRSLNSFCRKHKIPHMVPYSLRGMESSLRVEIAADRHAYDEEFKRGLARDKGHGTDFGMTYAHYINAGAKERAHESEIHQRQRVIEHAQKLAQLQEGILREALQRAQQQGLTSTQTLAVMQAAEQEFEARRAELEQSWQRPNCE